MLYFEIGSDTNGNTNVQRLKWQKKCRERGGGGTDRSRVQTEREISEERKNGIKYSNGEKRRQIKPTVTG